MRKQQYIFQSGCTIFHCYQQCMRVSILQILINSFYYLLDNTNPHRCEVVSYGFLVGISLVANDVEHLLMGLLTICKLTIEKYLLRSFAHFLIWSFIFLISFKCSLYILDTTFLPKIYFLIVLYLSLSFLFTFLMVSFVTQMF